MQVQLLMFRISSLLTGKNTGNFFNLTAWRGMVREIEAALQAFSRQSPEIGTGTYCKLQAIRESHEWYSGFSAEKAYPRCKLAKKYGLCAISVRIWPAHLEPDDTRGATRC